MPVAVDQPADLPSRGTRLGSCLLRRTAYSDSNRGRAGDRSQGSRQRSGDSPVFLVWCSITAFVSDDIQKPRRPFAGSSRPAGYNASPFPHFSRSRAMLPWANVSFPVDELHKATPARNPTMQPTAMLPCPPLLDLFIVVVLLPYDGPPPNECYPVKTSTVFQWKDAISECAPLCRHGIQKQGKESGTCYGFM